jgi:predicted flap endonuclease-1-like 5' DNA nuclease
VIAHIAEVWAAFVVAFVAGCVGGAVLFRLIARGSFASTQWAVSNAVISAGEGMRDTFGTTPAGRIAPRPARQSPSAPEPVADAVWDVVDQAIAERTAGPEIEDDATWLQEARDLDEPYVGGELGAGEPEEEQVADAIHDERDVADEAVATAEAFEDSREDVLPLAARANGTSPPMRSHSPLLPFAGGIPSARVTRPPRGQPLRPPLVVAHDGERPELGSAEALETRRPAMLKEPRNGVPDNLQRIRGIGERNEVRLNRLGIFHFSQIASWTPAEVRWIGQKLAFPERIERDDWVGQAITLASGRQTGFTKSAERRRERRRSVRGADDAGDDVLGEN